MRTFAMFSLEDVDNIPDSVFVHAGENTLTDKELKPYKADGRSRKLDNI